MKKVILLILIVILFSGCATANKVMTPNSVREKDKIFQANKFLSNIKRHMEVIAIPIGDEIRLFFKTGMKF